VLSCGFGLPRGKAAVAFAKRAANIGGDAIAIYIAAKGHARF